MGVIVEDGVGVGVAVFPAVGLVVVPVDGERATDFVGVGLMVGVVVLLPDIFHQAKKPIPIMITTPNTIKSHGRTFASVVIFPSK